MADPDLQPLATAAASHNAATSDLGARLEESEQSLYEQSRWVEDMVWESRSQIDEMCETLRSLSTRMDNLEAYLGLQDGAQPIAMYDGSATITYRTLGGASWR